MFEFEPRKSASEINVIKLASEEMATLDIKPVELVSCVILPAISLLNIWLFNNGLFPTKSRGLIHTSVEASPEKLNLFRSELIDAAAKLVIWVNTPPTSVKACNVLATELLPGTRSESEKSKIVLPSSEIERSLLKLSVSAM